MSLSLPLDPSLVSSLDELCKITAGLRDLRGRISLGLAPFLLSLGLTLVASRSDRESAQGDAGTSYRDVILLNFGTIVVTSWLSFLSDDSSFESDSIFCSSFGDDLLSVMMVVDGVLLLIFRKKEE
jgi:hypothetical protein